MKRSLFLLAAILFAVLSCAAEVSPALTADEAAALYEITPLKYTPYDRTDPECALPPLPARYEKGPDGAYRAISPRGDGEAVIMVTGDLMCQSRQQKAAMKGKTFDFNGSFDRVRDLFASADLVIGNLEAVISPTAPYMYERIKVENRPHLNAPLPFLDAVRRAGFDLVTMSNNHNCDAGVRGIYDTIERVDAFGLMHTGLYRGADEPRYILVDVNGIRVAVLSCATYFNTKEAHLTQEGQDALLGAYSQERLAGDIAQARSGGAEYVIVCVHWGTEYTNKPNARQEQLAQEIADAGADYIVGSHPHALQPYATVTSSDGRQVPVLYSMGNFVSHQDRLISKDSMILLIVLERDENGRAALREDGYIPARVMPSFGGSRYVTMPLTYPYSGGYSDGTFRPSYGRITSVIGKDLPILGEFR